MQIEILEFFPDQKGSKLGNLDFKVTYPNGKYEIFRDTAVFEKEGRRWIGVKNAKRGEKWLPTYERHPSPKALFDEVLKALKTHSQAPDQSGSIYDDPF